MKIKTLYIDPWMSYCGDCEKSVGWSAMICAPCNGEPPCDLRPYECLDSHYSNMADSVIPMRPDLDWVGHPEQNSLTVAG